MGNCSWRAPWYHVYRARAPAYRDLAARIAATDWLIDQVVYELYGLTEEEIAIVEGRAAQ